MSIALIVKGTQRSALALRVAERHWVGILAHGDSYVPSPLDIAVLLTMSGGDNHGCWTIICYLLIIGCV